MLIDKIKSALKLIGLYLLTGILSGALGTLFSKTIALVTNIRSQNNFIIYLLPIAGLLIVFMYDKLKVTGVGTNQVIKSSTGEAKLSPLITPAIFLGSAISHLFGASVGREGAALQLGGGLAAFLSRIFKLDVKHMQILTYCGMAGLFSAVFGTPFAAFVFTLQIAYVWKIRLNAILPTLVSSISAYLVAALLGTHAERFNIGNIPSISLVIILKVIVISSLAALVAMLFCYSIKWFEVSFEKLFKNPYFRIIAGGIITVFITILLKNNDYNGAGVHIIENIFEAGTFKAEAFFIKLVLTCIAVASGYKGGEIVPTLFIGATFGSLIASLIGLPVSLGAAVGMTALFSGVTNCPIAAIVLSLELFSGGGAVYMIIASIISYALSGNISLYSAQKAYKLIKPFKYFKKYPKNT